MVGDESATALRFINYRRRLLHAFRGLNWLRQGRSASRSAIYHLGSILRPLRRTQCRKLRKSGIQLLNDRCSLRRKWSL